ncbi:MAG: LysR family transcriptional regulator [Lachnospiraceae bacterium]|nr:LysR family transcriptional regulator [Lachnospiraceae bacterium]
MQLLNKRITCFLELASCLSFSVAAEHLNITQQAVTYQIAELEKELGVPLFIRTTRHVSLTHAGRIMRDEFLRISRSVDNAIAKVRDAEVLNYAAVTIGFLRILSRNRIIVPTLNMLQEKFRDVVFIVKLYDFVDLRNRLFDGELDICIAGCTDWPTWPSCEGTLIRRDPLVVVTGANSPLAREIRSNPDGLPTKADLERHPMLAVPDDVHLGSGPDYSYIPRDETIQVPDMETMLIHIAAGVGFACLTPLFDGSENPELLLCPAPFETDCRDIVAVHRTDMKSPLVLEIERELVSFLKNTLD